MANDNGMSEEQIIEALSNSGYLMEQEVATELERLGFFVQTNAAFNDVDEGKSREIDVIGYRRIAPESPPDTFAGVNVICECKNSKHPYFFVTRPKNSMDSQYTPREFVFPMDTLEQIRASEDAKQGRQYRSQAAFHRLSLEPHHHYFQDSNKAVQFGVLLKKNGRLLAEHAHVFDGIFYPLIKALEWKRVEATKFCQDLIQKKEPQVYIKLLIPMVVVSSDLYQIDSSTVPPTVSKQPFMPFVREIHTKSINGRFMVVFVQKNSLELYLNSVLRPLTDEILRLLREDHKVFIPEKNI